MVPKRRRCSSGTTRPTETHTSLLELILVLGEITHDDQLVVAAAEHLLRERGRNARLLPREMAR